MLTSHCHDTSNSSQEMQSQHECKIYSINVLSRDVGVYQKDETKSSISQTVQGDCKTRNETSEFLKTVGFIGFADKKCEGPIKTTYKYRPRCPNEKKM